MRRLSVVIPVFNEVKTISDIIRRVRKAPVGLLELEIIVVDDGSTDGTRELLARLERSSDLRVIFQLENRGKGAALRAGFAASTGDIILVQDADLEYDPNEYPKLLEPILDGRADVVYGSRFLGGPHRVLYFWHYLGNKALTILSNVVTDLNLSDMETCYKVFRADLLECITLESDRFGFEPEITAKLARVRCRIYEVPISYSGRTYEEGKKIGWKDGVSALYCIAKYGVVDRLLSRGAARPLPSEAAPVRVPLLRPIRGASRAGR